MEHIFVFGCIEILRNVIRSNRNLRSYSTCGPLDRQELIRLVCVVEEKVPCTRADSPNITFVAGTDSADAIEHHFLCFHFLASVDNAQRADVVIIVIIIARFYL